MQSDQKKKVAAAMAAVLQHAAESEPISVVPRAPGAPSRKKVAAAVAAVLQHLSAGVSIPEPQASPGAAAGPAPLVPHLAPAPAALWGAAGRQDAMHDRILWQRRLAKTW